jgi:3-hydroxyisobutyrate dehydrogenase-like beta-hydroxyacid dehydrogenase
MKMGIIGVGFIGITLTRAWTKRGHELTLANSRGPQSLGGGAIGVATARRLRHHAACRNNK